MRTLILLLFPILGISQGIEPYQIQYSTYKGGFLKATISVFDEAEQDTVYYYTHVDSIVSGMKIDSIQYFDDSLRIYTTDTTFIFSIDPSSTNEIQTIDTFQIYDSNKLRISLSSDGQPAKIVTLPTSIDSTSLTGGFGIVVSEVSNNWTIRADTSKLVTQFDITGLVDGAGLANRMAYWTDNNTITFDSAMYWNPSTNMIGFNTTNPQRTIDVVGRVRFEQGNDNVFISGGNTTLTGNSNVAIGENSLTSITTGNQNYAAGISALPALTTGSSNFAMGYQSQQLNQTGSANVAVGNQSLYSNVSGIRSVAVGEEALALSTASFNTGVGFYSLQKTTTGELNTGIGYFSGYNNTTGNNNVAVGFYSGGIGSNNTAVGYNSGRNNTGSSNVFLGYEAGNFTSTFDNRLYIDNSATTAPLIGGDFSTNRLGVNKVPSTVSTTLHVGGDLTVDTRTGTMATYAGFDSSGKLVSFTPTSVIDSTALTGGFGIIVSESSNNWTVRADTSKLATPYDLSLVDQSATNELQTISTSGAAGNITLSNGGGTLNLNVNDADASVTNEIQTIDTFQIFDTNKLRISLSSDGQAAKVVTLPTGGGGIDSTIVTGGWGIDVVESPANTFTVTADSSQVATQYDITGIVKGSGGLNRVAFWESSSNITSSGNFTFSSGNFLTLYGRFQLQATTAASNWNAFINGGNTTLTGLRNIGIGDDNTLVDLEGGDNNIALGAGAGANVTSGDGNVLIGLETGQSLTTKGGNIFIGNQAGKTVDIDNSLIIANSTSTTNGIYGDYDVSRFGVNVAPASLTRTFDINGQLRVRGAIYDTLNTSGSAGQVLTSQGTKAWTWTTPATHLTFSGASPYTLNSSSGTDVTFTAGSGIGLNATSGNITLTASDASETNEVQSFSLNPAIGLLTVSSVGGSGGGTATIPTFTHGIIYNNADLISLTLDATQRQVTFNTELDNNVIGNLVSESITVPDAGTFIIEYSGSYEVASPYGQTVRFYIYKNGSSIGYIGECKTKDAEGASGNVTSFNKSFMTTLAANDEIQLYYNKVAGTDATITINNINLMVLRIY